MQKKTNPEKRNWIVIVFAFANALLIYGVICYIVTMNRPAVVQTSLLSDFRVGGYGLSALMLVAGFWIFPRSTAGTIVLRETFMTKSIISLAFCDAVGIIGLVLVILGLPPVEYLPFGVLGLLSILFFVLPRGLRYWRQFEGGESGTQQGLIES
ncbi:MAG: hypothetical protein KJ970_16025 [Candidatus Eisenbacteria bacterium]|uniref:Uncharacterized protein n=1 Tax=Eiseniibacteriota bacterium TaxID=2212470 RepID=A0A948RZE2_UNCEI|nr:hypothetical protein [Candidatus Eisenbacteria bacterium]MBU1948805.1 hypothetical protein [Candidatus Eisenbacteria bacterium]MBU2692432.1 hypothetical protein [Candidatus Eisenbacteria bacterium]